MITQINPNIQFDYHELNNHIDHILVYLLNKSFTRNTKLLSNSKIDDEHRFHLHKLISLGKDINGPDANVNIKNNLIESFKKAHND